MKKVRKFLHHIFVSGNHNNHQAHSISHSTLTALLFLSIACLSTLPHIGLSSESVLGFATDIQSKSLLDVTNEQRIANGLSVLRENAKLTKAAQDKAEDMYAKGYWAHFGPNGETPWTFILSQDYDYEYAGENLAKNFMTSSAVVDAWMNSPTHRANILNGNYKDVGYAVVNGNLNGEDTTLVVQMFGSTLSDAPQGVKAASVTNAKNLALIPDTDERTVEITAESATTNTGVKVVSPRINLLPAYQFLSGIIVAFLIVAFAVDLFHISRTDFHRHRGKHIAHLIFLIAALIGIYMVGSGGIL